ncbi:MAG: GntR family transcriptional regulator [Janthinobacterium lividum]|jgi:DNA-binding GntR family transcriptional regulator|uniref:GntR family transcriptional regulator n=1 Tax=Pseudomonas baltica TaxID=2762576 RepID=UPI0028A1EB5E|nr:GntR family transcriptional regulator [Pseudomonas baltica]
MKRRVPTLASKIQSLVLDEIRQGQLVPGMHLEELELAERYQVSRTPVREALRQLDALGVVKITPRQGAIVVDHSTADHQRETLEVIADLEASAARYAASRRTPAQRSELLKLSERARHILATDDHAAFDALNLELHQLIHMAAANALLTETIANMRLRIVPYTRAELMSSRDSLEISYREHEMFLNAVLRGDTELAYHSMRAHVLRTGVMDEDLLDEMG